MPNEDTLPRKNDLKERATAAATKATAEAVKNQAAGVATRDPACVTRHARNCNCTGDMRGPIVAAPTTKKRR